MKVGAIDIGTNSMRLLVADVEDGQVEWLDRRTTVTGLGLGVDRSGTLDAAAVDRTIEVLAGYGSVLTQFSVMATRAVATSATRDAANRDEFLDRAEAALGVRPDVITGTEEAALAFAGATRAAPGAPPYLVIDIGGGSTEFVYGADRPEYEISIDIGSVRLTDRVLPSRPAPVDEMEAAHSLVAELLGAVELPAVPNTCIGVAGTFTSLAAINQDLPVYDPGRVHGSRLPMLRIAELVLYLASLSVVETEQIPSLDPRRAPVVLAGSVIAEHSARTAGVAEVVVSEHDTLDGIALLLGDDRG
ncbi:MAG: Ppx/GppA family phosphatase [Acidimicrobiia bacterium]|nr:Ppx/GppA family phosphatase [Acidimicrobiia bacterium]